MDWQVAINGHDLCRPIQQLEQIIGVYSNFQCDTDHGPYPNGLRCTLGLLLTRVCHYFRAGSQEDLLRR